MFIISDELKKRINGSVEDHIQNIYKLIEKVSKQTDEAKVLAEHAARGNVESSVEIRSIKEDMRRMEKNQEDIKINLDSMETLLQTSQDAQGKNLVKAIAWLVGIMIALLTLHGTIILEVISHFVK